MCHESGYRQVAMGDDEPTLKNFIAAFRGHWLDAMSGGASVPFAALAAFSGQTYQQIIFLCMAFACAWFAGYRVWSHEYRKAVTLEARLKPVFKLRFDPQAAIDRTIARETSTGADHLATYVRIHIDAVTEASVEGCKAAIVGLRKRNKDGELQSVSLPTTIQIQPDAGVQVRPKMSHHFDILVCDDKTSLHPAGDVKWPYILEDIFNDWTTYQLDIVVNAGNQTEVITIEVDWDGTWAGITGREI